MKTILPAAPDSAEFGLLLELTHPDSAIQAAEMVSAVNDPRFNQHTFLQMLRWHRVTPQVYQHLAAAKDGLPADFFQRLKADNLHCRQQHLRQSAWLLRIARALRADMIAFIVPKGAPLSQRLYGDQGYRQCRDIDIVVDAGNVDRVEAILLAAGFVRTMPHAKATPKQLRFLDRHKKDREYIHAKDRTRVELHWRLIDVDHPFNPSLEELLADAEYVDIHGESIPTLSAPLLWLYQCLHGSVSGWYRLRWLCDIALLIHHHPPEWQVLLQQAKIYRCSNSLLEAVGLACAFYRLPVPVAVQPHIDNHSTLQRQINWSSARLIDMQPVDGMAYIRRIGFWAPPKSTLNYLLVHTPIAVNDFKRIPLPDTLFFAYYLLRPFSFVLRRIFATKRIT